MAKRIPTTVSVTTRQMTPEEQKRFMVAIDALIGELVEREVDRRIAERRSMNAVKMPDSDAPSGIPN